MVGWHHQLNGHEFEQAPADGEGQESLVCCSTWGRKEFDTTERLNHNNSAHSHLHALVPAAPSTRTLSLYLHFTSS